MKAYTSLNTSRSMYLQAYHAHVCHLLYSCKVSCLNSQRLLWVHFSLLKFRRNIDISLCSSGTSHITFWNLSYIQILGLLLGFTMWDKTNKMIRKSMVMDAGKDLKRNKNSPDAIIKSRWVNPMMCKHSQGPVHISVPSLAPPLKRGLIKNALYIENY